MAFEKDTEHTRAASAKGLEARAKLEELRVDDPDAYIETKLEREKPALILRLLDAAYGRGDFAALPPDKRLTALIKALEYAAGKPIAGKAAAVEPVSPERPTGGLVVE